MKITETAGKNVSQIFKELKSSLQETDPDLLEIHQNFAFDEVLQYIKLDPKIRFELILSSLIAMNTMTEYKTMVVGALNVGLTPIEIKEVVYHAVPYVGFARVLEAIQITNSVLKEKGIELPLESQSTTSAKTRFDKGLTVQKLIFGAGIDKMHQAAPKNQYHIQKFLSDNCFGDYYTRTGLDVKTRELLTFSMLVSLGGCEPQVKAHVRGNVSVGNDKETLLNVVTQLLPYIGYPRTLNGIACINDIIPEN